jgi:hypothetical protein
MNDLARNPILWFLALGMGLFLAGCEDNPDTIDLKSKFATGGYTFYDLGNDTDPNDRRPTFLVKDVPVADVTILLTDADGSADSTVSDAKGYYEITGLRAGSYSWTVTATGYDTQEGVFALTTTEDFIENNMSMTETTPTMTAAWGSVSVVLQDGDQRANGAEGVAASYSTAANTTMTVTYSAVMNQGVSVRINGTSVGTLDASQTVLTITEAEVEAQSFVGSGNRLEIRANNSNCHLTPIHASFQCISADLFYTKGA